VLRRAVTSRRRMSAANFLTAEPGYRVLTDEFARKHGRN
jgi:hypothetical protein